MDDRLAFVGDIHGCAAASVALLGLLPLDRLDQVVFLGDYVNRGPETQAVLEFLVALAGDPKYVFLEGNHDAAMLEALESGDLGTFLQMGGAATIRSYVDGVVPPDVAKSFRDNVPANHLEFLRALRGQFIAEDVVATHDIKDAPRGPWYRVAGHTTIGSVPSISSSRALIDTGAGSPGGLLTALLWPSREYLQVAA